MSERGIPTPLEYRAEFPKAKQLDIFDPRHRSEAIDAIQNGEPAVIAFNGIYGIFGDVYTPSVAERIMEMKQRPQDKKLVVVSAPESLYELADFEQVPFSPDQIIGLQKDLHALGVILPANQAAPSHISANDQRNTILSIWTEYDPFRQLMEEHRARGGVAFTGTSANKSGAPTHYATHEVYEDFKHDVPIVLGADFSHLPPLRRKSTSVIRFEGETPILHREGNVTAEEINEALRIHHMPDLVIPEERKVVTSR